MTDSFVLTDMDYTRGAIAMALAEEMTLIDLWRCAEYAETAEDFDDAVNILAQMSGRETPRPCFFCRLRAAVLYVSGRG